MESLKIICLSVVSCIVYGIVHDQVTARVCVEYFTIGHPPVFETDDPTLLAFGWGTIATWWVGLMVGVPLAVFARAGRYPKLLVGDLVKPTLIVMAVSGLLAITCGCCGYWAATSGTVQLSDPFDELVPQAAHAGFIADFWAHNASYTSGFVGGLLTMSYLWYQRIKLYQKSLYSNRVS